MTYATASEETYSDVGFFQDDDTNTLFTLASPVFDDFRVYEGVLNSTELATEVACTDTDYTRGVWYG